MLRLSLSLYRLRARFILWCVGDSGKASTQLNMLQNQASACAISSHPLTLLMVGAAFGIGWVGVIH